MHMKTIDSAMTRPLAGAISVVLATAAAFSAAQAAEPQEAPALLSLDEVVVTATATGDRTKFESSTAVSTLDIDDMIESAPRNVAEIIRSIPGIRSESSGGSGNANISVRGIPVASGGGKFLQIQEEGLPVMQFGDIVLGTADQFLRADSTIARVEGVRSGSAIAFASNSPGGVVNFISKTGEEEGGSIGISKGVDYDNFRTDFEYGVHLTDSLRAHVGGFYRVGDGPRNIGFRAEQGGQIKANITKEFGDKGYARLYFKYLKDKVPTYLPMPLAVGGTNSNPSFHRLAGFDAVADSNIALGLASVTAANGRKSSILDGNTSRSTAIGGEFQFKPADGLTVTEKFRWAQNSGTFFGAFSADVRAATAFAGLSSAAGLAGANGVRYVGTSANLTNAQLAGLNGNGLIQNIRTFDSDLKDLGNFTNDFRITRSFGDLDVTVGYYRAYQADNIVWYWQTFAQDVASDPRLLDFYNGANKLTSGGLLAYGAPDWGGCCYRDTDVRTDLDAYYVNASGNVTDRLNVDATVRFDDGKGYGHYTGASFSAPGIDVNGNGVIDPVERGAQFFNDPVPLAWDWSYTSWSLGSNYTISDALAVYGRVGSGGRASDPSRLGDGGFFTQTVGRNGNIADNSAYSRVTSYEAGLKQRGDHHALFATVFYTKTDDAANSDGTRGGTNVAIVRKYDSKGVELEGQLNYGNFSLRGNATWTDAKIKFANDATVIGNTPRRQADFIYTITPSYTIGNGRVGLSLVGSTDAYTSDSNQLKLPGYNLVNLFGSYDFVNGFTVTASINNAFDALALTECEDGSLAAPVNGVVVARCRPFAGRSSEVSLSYHF